MQVAELCVYRTKVNCKLLKEPTTDCNSQQKGNSVIMILCVCIGFLLGLCWRSSSVEGKDSCNLTANNTACSIQYCIEKLGV